MIRPKTVSEGFRFDLRAVVYREGEWWIAHCVEMDVVAEGKTPDESIEALVSLCETQMDFAASNGDIESTFRPAPASYWKLFSMNGKGLTALKELPAFVHRFEFRELTLSSNG